MKVIVHHSHLTTSSNYDKSCGVGTSKKKKKVVVLEEPLCYGGSHICLLCETNSPLEEWNGRDFASFCLIHVNEVNIHGQKTLK